MNDINEIKKQLDELYNDYKEHKNDLNKEKTNKVVNFLLAMTYSKDATENDVAKELSRFSIEICKFYFRNLIKTSGKNVDVIDRLLESLLLADDNKNKSAFYAQKYSNIVNIVLTSASTSVFSSKMLGKIVLIVAKSAKSEKQIESFKNLINNTDGTLFLLDYSAFEHHELDCLWKLTQSIFPDMSKCKCEDYINDWSKKYDFKSNIQVITLVDSETKRTTQEVNSDLKIKMDNVSNDEAAEKNIKLSENVIQDKTEKKDDILKKSQEISDVEDLKETSNLNKNGKDVNIPMVVKQDNSEVLSSIFGEGKKTRELISKELISLQNTVNSFKADLSKSMEVANTNAILQRKIEKLESELETVKQVNDTQRIALEQLTKEKSEIEIKASEFEEQLKKAFDLDSRETENKADKVKF
ncbi:MAG: hypothetical protein Q4D76_18375, partial [Oscillospiraceae bacterium]|nr:hypothetical protein [Oscillospiraceae bacterium]